MHKATLLAGIFMSLVALSCGGGGGGGGGTPAIDASAFSGPYGVYGLFAETGPTQVTAQFGSTTADGASSLSGSLVQNTNGALTIGVSTEFDFTVAPSAALDWQFGLLGTVYSGGLARDGSVAVVGTVADGSSPGVQLLLRPSGSYNNASLNATYHMVMQSYFGPNFASSIGSVEFFGDGTAQRSVTLSNTEGTINTLPSWIGLGSYSVAPGGTITADLGLGLDSVGQILFGADLLVIAGSSTPGQQPLLMPLIRTTSGASNATFDGSYWAVSLRRAGAGFLGEVADVTANGSGTGTISGWENNGTTVIPFGARPFTYTVQPDGQLDLVGGTTAYRGAVSGDGRFAMLGGSTTSGEDPTIYFLMRK